MTVVKPEAIIAEHRFDPVGRICSCGVLCGVKCDNLTYGAHVVERLAAHGHTIVPTDDLGDIEVTREQALELAHKWSDAATAVRKFEYHWPADCLMEAAGFIIGASAAAASATTKAGER